MALSTAALTTVARMETELSITSASAALEPLIEEASAELHAACNRKFYRASSYAESVPGFGGARLLVNDHLPLVSVASVVLDTGSTSTTVDATSYEIEDAETGFIRRISGSWSWTTRSAGGVTHEPHAGGEESLYTVTYTGGYVTPQQAADDVSLTRTLPYDIERAVIDITKALYWGRGRDPGVRGKSVSRASVQYGGSLMELPNVHTVIQRYRRIGVA